MYARSRKINRITAIIAALAALFTGLLFALPNSVYADEWDDDDVLHWNVDVPDDYYDHVCYEDCYENIFYFSDSEESKLYMQLFLSETIEIYSSMHSVFNGFYWYDLKSEGAEGDEDYIAPRFGESMYDFNNTEFNSEYGFNGVGNSLVIFELRDMFPIQIVYPYNLITQDLAWIFSRLKDQGCQIMFICGTDEMLFNSYGNDAFLDYVDFHVNMDLYSYFVNTFCNYIARYGMCAGLQYGSTIIVDKDLSDYILTNGAYYGSVPQPYYYQGSIYGYYNDRNNLIDSMLIPFLRIVADMPAYEISYKNGVLVLQELNIRVLFHKGGNRFYDAMYRCERIYDLESVSDDVIDSPYAARFFFVGTTRLDNGFELEGWLCDIKEALDLDKDTFMQFMFIENGSFDKSEHDPDIYTAGKDRYQTAAYLMPMMYDFIFGRDYGAYDNWEGRCDVTAKPLSRGGGNGSAWLEDFSEEISDILDEDMSYFLYEIY